MSLFTSTVTNYNGDDDVISTGLTLEQAVLKVQRNIYGYDHDEKHVSDSISAFASSERGANFFCADNTAQVKIKLEG